MSPENGAHILGWFWELSGTRSQSDSWPRRLSPLEIAAWLSLSGNVLTRDEIKILQNIDAAYVQAVNEEYAAQLARETEGRADN